MRQSARHHCERLGGTNIKIILSRCILITLCYHSATMKQNEHGEINGQPIFPVVGYNQVLESIKHFLTDWSQYLRIHDAFHLSDHDVWHRGAIKERA